MKNTLMLGMALGLTLVGCEDFNRPITAGDFDPLSSPGSMRSVQSQANGFRGGQFVTAIMDNTAFFLKRPSGDADADKLLPQGTSMKVIAQVDNYVKVELDSGEIGFVPAIMVEDPNQISDTSLYGNPGEFQLYPPVEGFEAPPEVLPGEMPPEGAIPTVVDPTAPPATGQGPQVDLLPKLPPAEQSGPAEGTPSGGGAPPSEPKAE